jgi:hypothetical protein
MTTRDGVGEALRFPMLLGMSKGRCVMWRFLFTVLLVMACATGVAADPIGDAKSAYGRGDYEMATQLFRSRAEQGDPRAQNNLGGMYTQGRGVPQDFIRAHMWFNVAAAALTGDERKAAIKNRDNVASQLTAVQIGKAEEMARRCQDTKFKECE